MMPTHRVRASAPIYRVRSWAMWDLQSRVLTAVLVVEGVAALLALNALGHLHDGWPQVSRLAVLMGSSLVFEEFARNVGKVRRRLVDSGYVDMTSVWLLAGTLALHAGYAVVLIVGLNLYNYLRHQASEGRPAYRACYTTAVLGLSYFTAAGAVHNVGLARHLPIISAVLAVVTFLIVNRLLVALVIVLQAGISLEALLGRPEDSALELATLCLGALTGVAVIYEPSVAALALLPTYALQRGALVRELEVAASQDAKTGLLNAASWHNLAKRELARVQRSTTPAALVIIDLDHFKVVNDTYGHMAGDEALRRVGDCLRDQLRSYDTVGRFGGEEFVAILPGVDRVEATVIADRLRRAIHRIAIPGTVTDVEATLSSSIGIACFPEHGWDLEDLILNADSALYVAKANGRNRVEFATRDGATPAAQPESSRRPGSSAY